MVDFLSRRSFLNVVSLVKDTIFYKIKGFYKDDVFSSITFKSLSKKSKDQKIIDKFFCVYFGCGYFRL